MKRQISKDDVRELHDRISKCKACSLCETATQKVILRGCQKDKSLGLRPLVLFCGEAPGAEEDVMGKPFVGASGRLLQQAIDEAGLDSYVITNMCLCRPPDNREPTNSEKIACSKWLEEHIELLNPQIIVPVGSHAMKYFLPDASGITQMAGKLHQDKYFVLVHPSYYLRNGGKSQELKQHVKQLADILKTTSTPIIAAENYIPLHCHTQYSVGDGYGKPQDIALAAKNMGFAAYGITDHGTLQGTIYMQKALKAQGIKPLVGIEAYVIDDNVEEKDKKKYHVTLLIKNEVGWKRILELNDKSNRTDFYYKPRIKLSDLCQQPDGIIAMTACMGGIINALFLDGEVERSVRNFKQLHSAFKEDLYFEIMPNAIPEQTRINQMMLELAKQYNVKCVCTTDVHYLKREDEKVHKAIKAIGMKKTYEESGFSTDEFYLHSGQELRQEFQQNHPYIDMVTIENMMANTVEVANKINFIIPEKLHDTLPQICYNPDEVLKIKTIEGLTQYTPYTYNGDIKQRIDMELDRFSRKKFTNYFLIVEDYVRWCKQQGIAVGPGRGSIGGSLAAYALGITDVDTLQHDLLFDRFISEARTDYPDADIDFQDTRREELLNYLKSKYGEDHVAHIITFSTWAMRGAVRDVARIFNIPENVFEPLSRAITASEHQDKQSTLNEVFESSKQTKQIRERYPEACEIMTKLEGHIRHRGMHAAGIVITKNPIHYYVPIEKLKGEYVTAWEKDELANLGIIKFDMLGLKTLDVIMQTLQLINKTWNDLPKTLDDARVYNEIFKTGRTLGTFQTETSKMQQLCQQLGVNNFNLLYDAITLYRPGPIYSGQLQSYANRLHAIEKWNYIHPLLEPITKNTFGLILYQEQVMQTLVQLGHFSWADAEKARKVISKSQGQEAFETFRSAFIDGAYTYNNIPKDIAAVIFEMLSAFGTYGYNKSHAVEYAMLTYYTGWLKTYFPQAFYTALLSREDDEEKIKEYTSEMKQRSIILTAPHINKSKIGFNLVGNEIVAGFDSIKGIGLKSAEKIIENQPYNSIEDFIASKPSKTIWEKLTNAGVLDSLHSDRAWLLENREILCKKKKGDHECE